MNQVFVGLVLGEKRRVHEAQVVGHFVRIPWS